MNTPVLNIPRLAAQRNLNLLVLSVLLIMMILAILQDYFFSRIHHSSFYLSESLLYNGIWLLILPLSRVELCCYDTFIHPSSFRHVGIIGIALVITGLHLVLFALGFVTVSALFFSPAHRFITMFNAAASNQFYIILTFYTIFPYLQSYLSGTRKESSVEPNVIRHVQVRSGNDIVNVEVESIQSIETDRPFIAVFTADRKYLLDKTLNDLEHELDSDFFLRVHRSTLINARFVKSLKTRKNGDYDAVLENGRQVRLSRHLRKNWDKLLQ